MFGNKNKRKYEKLKVPVDMWCASVLLQRQDGGVLTYRPALWHGSNLQDENSATGSCYRYMEEKYGDEGFDVVRIAMVKFTDILGRIEENDVAEAAKAKEDKQKVEVTHEEEPIPDDSANTV